MRELWTHAFSDACDRFSQQDRETIDPILDELLVEHTSASMRASLRTIASGSVWSTRRIYLTNDVVRISWQYGDAEDVIVMVVAASIEAV